MTLISPQRRKTALNSDALTGEWLVPGSPRYVVHIPTHRRRPRYLESGHGEPAHAPVTLHRHTTEGHLGGPEYSLLMAGYLAALSDELRREQRAIDRAEALELLAWWKTSYGVTRVWRGLKRNADAGKMSLYTAFMTMKVALMCHREQAEPSELAAQFSKPAAWVYDKVDLCMKAAGYHRADCQCPGCEDRRQRTAGHEAFGSERRA